MIGRKILNYQIDKLIGEGGMGNVYLGTHSHLDRKVAIKSLHPILARNHEIRERFKNEAAALSQLNHPNVVALHDYIEQDNEAYLVMEYVEGLPLDEYIQTVSGPIPEEKAIKLFTQILDGVAYAHSKNIIHRDIKPSNFLITKEGIVKILGESSHKLTKTGAKIGTILYMSPEQIKGLAVDKKTDIYSLGITLFQMLSGKCPYDENSTEYEICKKIVEEPLPRAKDFYIGVSPQMQSVIDKATSKNHLDRFQNCEEFKDSFNEKSEQFAKATINSTFKFKKTIEQKHKQEAQTAPKKKNLVWLWASLGVIVICGIIAIIASQTDSSDSGSGSSSNSNNTASPDQNYSNESNAQAEKLEQQRIEQQRIENEKQSIRNNIYSYVILKTSSYYYKEVGGISDFTFSITNNTNYYIDYVMVYIESYNPETGKSFCGETTTFSGIPANSTSNGLTFSCTRGTKVNCNITSIVSSELNLK